MLQGIILLKLISLQESRGEDGDPQKSPRVKNTIKADEGQPHTCLVAASLTCRSWRYRDFRVKILSIVRASSLRKNQENPIYFAGWDVTFYLGFQSIYVRSFQIILKRYQKRTTPTQFITFWRVDVVWQITRKVDLNFMSFCIHFPEIISLYIQLD